MITPKEIAKEELENLKQRIRTNFLASGQNASGRTVKSLQVREGTGTVALWGRSPFATTETGRKAGKGPFGFFDIIKQWILDKGISFSAIEYKREPSERWIPKYTPKVRGLMLLAGAIAYTIKKEGTRLHRSGGRDDVYSSEIPKTIESIKNRTKSLFWEEIIKSIKINK